MKVTPVKKKFRSHSPGDVFELPERSAKLLIKVGLLKAADETTPAIDVPAEAPVETAAEPETVELVEVAVEPSEVEMKNESAKPTEMPARQQYQHRALQAQTAPRKAPAKKTTRKASDKN